MKINILPIIYAVVCIFSFTSSQTVDYATACSTNNECENFEKCVNNTCIDPCLPDTCGVDETCRIIDHEPACFCITGYGRHEYSGECRKLCSGDRHCKSHQTCRYGICMGTSYCGFFRCGINTECKTEIDAEVCSCQPGFTGNLFVLVNNKFCYLSRSFFTVSCRTNNECPIGKKCVDSNCVETCDSELCGTNASCRVLKDHYAGCRCLPGFHGDPKVNCTEGCVNDSDCDDSETCEKNKCIENVCADYSCTDNSHCIPDRDGAKCVCNEGYVEVLRGDSIWVCEEDYAELQVIPLPGSGA